VSGTYTTTGRRDLWWWSTEIGAVDSWNRSGPNRLPRFHSLFLDKARKAV